MRLNHVAHDGLRLNHVFPLREGREPLPRQQPACHRATSRTGMRTPLGSILMSRCGDACIAEMSAREIAFEPAKLLRCDDDHFVAPVHRHVLRSVTADPSHQFAKPRLGILQEPVAGPPAATYLAPALRLVSQL
jgi:hypothetical protein